jgi:hypothetical protein
MNNPMGFLFWIAIINSNHNVNKSFYYVSRKYPEAVCSSFVQEKYAYRLTNCRHKHNPDYKFDDIITGEKETIQD